MRLGNLCDIVRGSSPRPKGDPRFYGGSVPRLMVADVTRDGKYVTPRIDSLTQEGAALSRPMQKGDLVIAVSGNPGLPAILEKDACIHDGFVGLRSLNRTRISVDYLYCYLIFFKEQINNKAVGAIFKNLTTHQIADIKIPLPPLEEQKRIAAILDKADAVRRKRQEAIRLTEELLRSQFLEMFGDPVTNPKGWEVKPLAKVALVNRGKFTPRPRNDPKFYDGIYPFIQTGDIAAANGYLTKYNQTLNELGAGVSRSFKPDTIVIAIVGATIGETAILSKEMYCPDSVVGIEPNNSYLSSEYVEYALRSWKDIFRSQAPETARANINLEILRPLSIALPPFKMQEDFQEIYRRVHAVKYREKLVLYDKLFNSLLQRAFQGEL